MKSALFKLHIAIFLWGFTGVLGSLISLNEGLLVWWRLLITVTTLWLLSFRNKEIRKLSGVDFIKIASIGCLSGMHWLCFYGSIKYSNVSIALTCLATTALLSAFIEPLFFRKRISLFEICLGLLALFGIGLIYFSNLAFSTGIYIGLMSAVFIVFSSVLNKRYVTHYRPQTVTLYQITGAFICISALMPFYNYLFPATSLFPSGKDWVWLLILSWFCTVVTYDLYISAFKKVSAFTINLTTSLEPVYGIILAFAINHENKYFGHTFYMGFLLIIAAVLIQMLRSVRKKGNEIVIQDAAVA
jgi:drug/metabolite transporter (DMT)-like permease